MNALLKRIRPTRDAAPEATEASAPEAPEAPEASGSTVDDAPAASPVDEPATAVLPTAEAPEGAAPAGLAPEDLVGERPDTRRRSRLRRRLRHLRQVREILLRDVGGLVYELHRSGADATAGPQANAVVQAKLERLAALDLERRELEATLDATRARTVLREPGVGGACPGCGDYFASDAHFCARCGTRVDGRETAVEVPA